MPQHPPITPEGLAGCLDWLKVAKADRKPDHKLLVQGLPQGNLWEATVGSDGAGPFIEVGILDGRGTPRRRLFDPAGFLALRLLLLPRGSIRLSRTDHEARGKRQDLDYPTIFDGKSLLRVLADARPGVATKQARKQGRAYRDLRRRNLRLEPGAGHHGRKQAIRTARDHFKKDTAAGRLRDLPKIGAGDYKRMLDGAFTLLDKADFTRGG
jgi:hypothetical protein